MESCLRIEEYLRDAGRSLSRLIRAKLVSGSNEVTYCLFNGTRLDHDLGERGRSHRIAVPILSYPLSDTDVSGSSNEAGALYIYVSGSW